MSCSAEPTGTIDVALAHAVRMLRSEPALAEQQADEILKVVPGHPAASLVQGAAYRLTGRPDQSAQTLGKLVRAQPRWADAHYELALTLCDLEKHAEAVTSLRTALSFNPDMAEAWRLLAAELTLLNDIAGADAAQARAIKCSTKDPRLLAAAAALCANEIPRAEALLRAHLKTDPTDVTAIRMFAEVAARLRRHQDAENLLARCIELAPGFEAARHNYAVVLHRQNKPLEALREIELLLGKDPRNPMYRNLKAAILTRIGEYEQSLELYSDLLATAPGQPKIWMSYGHALKTKGREEESIRAYERSIELLPTLGEAYWSLANLKTVRFSAAQIDAMRTQLSAAGLSDEDRFHLHFALGKALEDEGCYQEAFEHYDQGNGLRRSGIRYSAEEMTVHVQRCKTLFTEEFFAARAGYGNPARDPIFIVGLPRAGSTLIEQILASHSQVEGTMELPDIPGIAKSLAAVGNRNSTSLYPEALQDLGADEIAALGARYLQQTRVQRKSAAPFFVDKMPNNFAHVGLIHLLLPNARIIDARRHPLGCCFSCFKQHFARGQHFTYSLEELGRYYRDYVELMAHFDAVLPGRVHRVFYEAMIEDTETEVRRLLEYCGLPFEAACLHFYANERAVRTASSQQVRQPIYRGGLDQWQHFEPWLGPLRTALGPVLAHYPDARSAQPQI